MALEFLCALTFFLVLLLSIAMLALYADARDQRKVVDRLTERFKQYDRTLAVRALSRVGAPFAVAAAACETEVPADPNVETEGDRQGINPGESLGAAVEVQGPPSGPGPISIEGRADLTPEELARVDALAARKGLTRQEMMVALLHAGAETMEAIFRGPPDGPANGNGKPEA